MKKIAVIILLTAIATAAKAVDYQVETIVFEQLNADTDSELWQIEGVLPALPESIDLLPRDEILAETGQKPVNQFVIQPMGNYKLTALYNSLMVSSKYRPLMHLAWEQPALDQGEAEYVRLTLLEQPEPDPNGANYDDLARLAGTIRIRSSHFLHADVHLLYLIDPLPLNSIYKDQDNQNQDQESLIIPEYQASYAEMKETRRIKLNELYYFDHPGFGLILRVSRIEQDSGL